MTGIFTENVLDDRMNRIGSIRKIFKDGKTPVYYCSDFEKLLNFQMMRCSQLSYLIGKNRITVPGCKYIFGTWKDIKVALKKIRNPNNLVLSIIDRELPTIPNQEKIYQIHQSKMGKFLSKLDDDKRMLALASFFKIINDPCKFAHFIGFDFKEFNEKITINDILQFSALEMSQMLFPLINNNKIEEKPKKIPEVTTPINIPIGDGKTLSLTININIDGKH